MIKKNSYLTSDLLLENSYAKSLYHDFASNLPIIDYHNHINIGHLSENHMFSDIAELWVLNDPYKHRAMRINGIDEGMITGNATNWDKFYSWAATHPKTIGNPLYHWSTNELNHVFNVEDPLNEESALRIWKQCNSKLEDDKFSACSILRKWNIEGLCTSDDWLTDLSLHNTASNQCSLPIIPSLRADSLMDFNSSNYQIFLNVLARLTGVSIVDLESLEQALEKRIKYFSECGSRLSDHALDSGFSYKPILKKEAESLFKQVKQHQKLNADEIIKLRSYLLAFLGKLYGKMGWVMQLHIGALRTTSSRLRDLSGNTGGYAAIGNSCNMESLSSFLDELEREGYLPDVILYTLNPSDNESFGTLTGSFSEDGKEGKIQFGPAWWYNDHAWGIENHLTVVSNYSLLFHFIGMTTDSRSLLSFSRHDYFRRILCNLIGKWIEKGHIPNDYELVSELITNICYANSKKRFFNE
ncbi:glucuronate isomerase [Ulvibacterium sp.]|uniref:glucuronate isomerase n=1 Tax=Ulvibacterium sp. TaxID=2665914 RepID=UPI003BAD9AE6